MPKYNIWKDERFWKKTKNVILIAAAIGAAVYGFYTNWSTDKAEVKQGNPRTENNVDSGTLNNIQHNKDVFINSGSGQQNNNTDSGQQTINNY